MLTSIKEYILHTGHEIWFKKKTNAKILKRGEGWVGGGGVRAHGEPVLVYMYIYLIVGVYQWSLIMVHVNSTNRKYCYSTQ